MGVTPHTDTGTLESQTTVWVITVCSYGRTLHTNGMMTTALPHIPLSAIKVSNIDNEMQEKCYKSN